MPLVCIHTFLAFVWFELSLPGLVAASSNKIPRCGLIWLPDTPSYCRGSSQLQEILDLILLSASSCCTSAVHVARLGCYPSLRPHHWHRDLCAEYVRCNGGEGEQFLVRLRALKCLTLLRQPLQCLQRRVARRVLLRTNGWQVPVLHGKPLPPVCGRMPVVPSWGSVIERRG